ncbi:MAG: hypothetical protein KPI85_04055 [cyanobacterium endosymbiont of Epithemia adnata isolate EadnSB Bon19]|uniref:hypothetical protein n=1 Tax=cyanobacterium endosymbiont of Epithemia turgida TaxID=718217 RepID=UPI0004D0E224|nr:hypothetical protein [cyanobacterium endosymbiont of Epithemia turgida]BAP18594.1 hypothetical protein ETSB_1906 [cyanobacterium endosymbiont of Epithemia turgida isolate EtSB Lake Yunoko]
MFSKTTTVNENVIVIRNYIILATTVMIMSSGLVDTFVSPFRAAQQNRLDNYGRYVSAGLVAQAQKFSR